ncbi:MAG: stage II sporulation protein M, partial [archaeon]
TKVIPGMGTIALLKEHRHAIYAFLWLFMGFIVAFSIWYIVLPSNVNFSAQIQTYCSINRPGNFDACVQQYIKPSSTAALTGHVTSTDRLLSIFSNNMYVLLFTLLFSLIIGAGAIFILAWNATVIAAAIGIFTKSDISSLPMGLLRYMIHGIPEIGSYFIVALAGGMVSVAVIKHESGTTKFWDILQDSLNLILVAVAVLAIAAIIEVYITPIFF